MSDKAEWFARWDAWNARAVEQARELYPTGHLEVCEDGSVYLGNYVWAPARTVEPWSEI
jgi:hypothetical protein